MCSLEQTGRLLCSVEVRFGANTPGPGYLVEAPLFLESWLSNA